MPPRRQIRAMFESISGRYDLGNRVLSLGIDRRWRRHVSLQIAKLRPCTVLDLCCGSGDLALSVLPAVPEAIRCVGIDLAEGMLSQARSKAEKRGHAHHLAFLAGDIENMPFPDHAFDVAMVGFGIRNVESIPNAIREVIRVLRPGGTFFSLEFSKTNSFPLNYLYPFYLHHVLPRVGGWISGEPGAYRYLAESIAAFPDQPSLASAFEAGGLQDVHWTNLSGGIVAVHVGRAPGDALEGR